MSRIIANCSNTACQRGAAAPSEPAIVSTQAQEGPREPPRPKRPLSALPGEGPAAPAVKPTQPGRVVVVQVHFRQELHSFDFDAPSSVRARYPSLTFEGIPCSAGRPNLPSFASTQTCVDPPTALTTSSPFLKTPTSYTTLVFPSLATRSPSSSTPGYSTEPK